MDRIAPTMDKQAQFSSGDWFMGTHYTNQDSPSVLKEWWVHIVFYIFCRLFVQIHHDQPNVTVTIVMLFFCKNQGNQNVRYSSCDN
jgi:hypothetical protein